MTVQEWLGAENKLGIDIWEKKYRYENETFDEWLDRVSGGNQNIRHLIQQKKFLFGGRILANRGLDKNGLKVTLSNCYVVSPPEDNLESIYDTAKKLARTFSYGGGCGVDIGKLCPKDAKVNNTAKKSSGAVSFMDLYNMTTGLIGQGGRRGALMISIPVNHPDVEDFIKIKSDLSKITNANISIRVDDKFMEAVKSDSEYELRFVRDESGEVIAKTVKAKELFHKICEMNWNYAEPGILFWDTISEHNLLAEDESFAYAGTNPCVTGDTLILTDKGYVKIRDVVDTEVNIWNGYRYSKVTPHITGHNQKMKRITFSDGNQLDCTRYHKFILSDGTRVEANDLIVGSKLVKCHFPVIHSGVSVDKKFAYTQGYFMGDGSSESSRDRLSIKLYGAKRCVKPYLAYVSDTYCDSFGGDYLTLPFIPDAFNKQYVPNIDYGVEARLAWLAGYIDSDGTSQSSDGSISISSVNKDVLLKVKYMLNTLGCNAWVSKMHDQGLRKMPKNDGTGEYQEVFCQNSYRLLMSAVTVRHLINLGMDLHRVEVNPDPNRNASRFITVKNVEDIDDCETVYCFNEPINHSGIFNGVITAQCAEEPLPAGGSCCLAALNLAEFVKQPFTEKAAFDFDSFHSAVFQAVYALNEILDEGMELHPLEEQKESVHGWRQIGLGIMGLADALVRLGLVYGSYGANYMCNQIAKNMFIDAVTASEALGFAEGSYPMFNEEAVNNSDMMIAAGLKVKALRNSQLLTIAPTGSISTMLGISGGIEPIFANSYTRKTQSLHGKDEYYKVYTPIVREYMETHGIENEEDLPEQFVVASDVSPGNRIACQSTWQTWIDASISSTINLPNETTIEDIENIYMSAWESGLKGVTVYRAGCAREGVLVTDSTNNNSHTEAESTGLERGYVVPADDNLIGMKRKLMTGCGSLHCVAFFDAKTKELRETYLAKGSTGGCNNFMIGLSRLISLSARAGVSIENIVDQLNSCGVCPSYATRKATKGDTSPGSCCPIAVGKALKEMYDELNAVKQDDNVPSNAPKCPKCGAELINEGGCNICKNCGWSKCD